jgi:hypothetical protein
VANNPNFFIIGAPKCGTTAMSEYLRTHPNVFMSNPKEPRYFSFDVAPCEFPSFPDYLAIFDGANSNQTVIAEASQSYLRSKVAIHVIRALYEDSKLLIMLRNPVDLVYSFHTERRRAGTETDADFERAWKTEVAKGSSARHGDGSAEEAPYQSVGKLGEQVKRVLDVFPREQVFFIVFDEFASNPRRIYLDLLEFLGVPDDGRMDFPKVNEATQFKSERLAVLQRHVRRRLYPLWEVFKRLTGVRSLGIMRIADRYNTKPQSRAPLRPEFRRELAEFFSEEIALLEDLLGRDLSVWRVPGENARPKSSDPQLHPTH